LVIQVIMMLLSLDWQVMGVFALYRISSSTRFGIGEKNVFIWL
jgi:hypothetical protein